MKIGITSGLRYHRVGNQYYSNSQFVADMWAECLEVFDEVILANRVIYKNEIGAGDKPVLGDGIRLVEFPNASGLWSNLCNIPHMLSIARHTVKCADVWHLHTPNLLTFCIYFWLWWYKIPYSLELRGDQSINIAYLKLRGVKFACLVVFFMRSLLWLQMSRPLAVSSVTRWLVDISKPRNHCPVHIVSNARIPSKLFHPGRSWKDNQELRTIVCLGRLEAQKNPIGTLKALNHLRKMGFTQWKLIWIGDGPLKDKTIHTAAKMNMERKINLLGFVPWDQIFPILDKADLFLLNSTAEGLPRAILEAMASALPVVATRTGGWKDILPAMDTVPSHDHKALAEKLFEVLSDTERLTSMSRRNLAVAQYYSAERLRIRKIAFYADVKSQCINRSLYRDKNSPTGKDS